MGFKRTFARRSKDIERLFVTLTDEAEELLTKLSKDTKLSKQYHINKALKESVKGIKKGKKRK